MKPVFFCLRVLAPAGAYRRLHLGCAAVSLRRNADECRLRVKPAFLRVGVFPPPAPRTGMFAGGDGAGAGGAADAGKAAIVQCVVGHFVTPQVGPDFEVRPIQQRIELGQAEDGILFLDFYLGARGALFAPEAGEPGAFAGQGAAQRLDLAHFAAGFALRDAVVEAVDAVDFDQTLDRAAFGKKHFHLGAVTFADSGEQLVGFRMQAAGVEGEHVDARRVLGDQVEQHHVFGAEAGGEGCRLEFALDFLQERNGFGHFGAQRLGVIHPALEGWGFLATSLSGAGGPWPTLRLADPAINGGACARPVVNHESPLRKNGGGIAAPASPRSPDSLRENHRANARRLRYRDRRARRRR